MQKQAHLKDYYRLAKPGIIYGNSLAAIAGFLLAAQGQVNVPQFLGMLVGLGLIIGSACVCNNVMDRGIDRKMARTKKRALVQGIIAPRQALIYAAVLGLMGAATLAVFTNTLTLVTALFGHFMYVVVYGYFKRRSVHGTEVGSISGAVPPVVGYVAVTGRYDTAALLLFFLLVFWQMPHFYAIAMFRRNDYADAGVPVLPVVRSFFVTKIYCLVYIVLFTMTAACLTLFGYTGLMFMVLLVAVSVWWLWIAIQGLTAPDDVVWARRMFKVSLIVLLSSCLLLSLDHFLP